MEQIELIEKKNTSNEGFIIEPKLDGYCSTCLRNYIISEDGEDVANNVFKNAIKGMCYFISPHDDNSLESSLSKILSVGRVQSGKTSYFIATIALAFDNDYSLTYLIGGTKNTLRDQNYDRVSEYFSNNEKVLVYDVNHVSVDTVRNKLSKGFKIILVILKNSSEEKNLGKANILCNYLNDVPSLVVDDEGDEYTPGAPKLFYKNNRIGATHDSITSLIYSINKCTYLSVTATPQANFLISTIDSVSPDFCVMVDPGDEYTGGNAFHDTYENPHVVEILDTDDFKTSIPDSFMNALYFFLFAICLKRKSGIYSRFSMLVHPSSLTKVQNVVVDKIKNRLEEILNILRTPNDVAFNDIVSNILNSNSDYVLMNSSDSNLTYDDVVSEIPILVNELRCFEFNISSSGKIDINEEKNDDKLYRIYVGGNMLGRGLTIKNLIVTYMYRDSKIQAIDTLYQRARWFGYKRKYFDVCRVYMTDQLKNKFVTIVENENDMWNSLNSYLSIDDNIKRFPRIFALNDDSGKLILTRKTVSKTLAVERINPGFTYDKSIWLSYDNKCLNRKIYENYFNIHKNDGKAECFSSNDYQTHFVINTKFTCFYQEFLSKYIYPRGSKFGQLGIGKILSQINEGLIPDDLVVIVMRYKTKEYRALTNEGSMVIKELPQSYNENTRYDGDKSLPYYKDVVHFQIHLVYVNDVNDYIPLLCFNNPLTKNAIKQFKYVTGDNVYDSI